MKQGRTTQLAIQLLAFAPLAGCSTPFSSRVDEHWGEAHRANVSQMIADPDAGYRDRELPPGLDPTTGTQVIENHRKRQAAKGKAGQSKPTIFNIGTGAR